MSATQPHLVPPQKSNEETTEGKPGIVKWKKKASQNKTEQQKRARDGKRNFLLSLLINRREKGTIKMLTEQADKWKYLM